MSPRLVRHLHLSCTEVISDRPLLEEASVLPIPVYRECFTLFEDDHVEIVGVEIAAHVFRESAG